MTGASSQRTALLEKHRYINTEYDTWWDCVEADFIEDMKKVGIAVDRIYFSGFWSQGDGACFVGSLDNALTYLDHHHQGQYPMIRKLLEHGGIVSAFSYSGHRYYHSRSASISVEADLLDTIIDCPTDFHLDVVEAWQRELDIEMADFEKDVTEQWRSYMDDLYRNLEKEYDYLTSDEAVWDTIEANELIEDVEEEEVQ